MKRLAWGVVFLLACGGKTDLSDYPDGSVEASVVDAKPVKDVVVVDVSPPPYVPLGTKCVVDPDAGAPPVWVPDDGGAPLHPPQVVSSGGPVLGHPVFVPITFDGDDLVNPIEDFLASVGCTSYWHSVMSDYGVGDAYSTAGIHLSDKPPDTIDDPQIGAFIRTKILGKLVPDAVQDSTLYVIFYPEQTDITLQGEHSCQSYGGYHSNFVMSDGRSVPYAVIPRCGNFGQLGGIDAITAVTSHELMEASSDPLPFTNPAYQFTEGNGLAWALAGGGEVGDMCEFNSDADFLPSDYPFYVQRQWSDHKAWFAQNPCQPTTTTYVAAAPLFVDTLSYNIGLGPQTTTGIKLAVGNQTTIDVKIIADGPWTSPVTVVGKDGSSFLGGGPKLSLSVSPSSGNVGDTLKLTVTRTGTNSTYGVEPFYLRASSSGAQTLWWGVVGDPE